MRTLRPNGDIGVARSSTVDLHKLLVQRIRGSDHIDIKNLVLRSARCRVSKDGHREAAPAWPSFETSVLRTAPQDEVR